MSGEPIVLMQDGYWLVDQEGFRIAMPVTGGVYLTGTTKTLPELRALVAWMEQQEVGAPQPQALDPEAVKELLALWRAFQGARPHIGQLEPLTTQFAAAQAQQQTGDLVAQLQRLADEVKALRRDMQRPGPRTAA